MKIHLHIENTSSLGPVFEASSDRVTASLERASGLENALRVTIGYDGDNLEESLSTADAVFCWDLPRDRLSDRAPNLRWIHVHGAGINHWMPFENLPRRITLTNSRGVHGKRATEYVMMAVLALNNRLPEMVTHQRSGVWQQCFSTGLAGKTLLIIGVGHIGSAVARWAKSVELNVVGIRRSGKPRRWVDQMYQTHDLLSVLPRADFVLVSAPHTRETDQLIGALELQRRSELFGAAGRVPINGEAVEGDRQLTGAIAIQQIEAAAWGQEALQAVPRQCPPGRAQHQQYQAGVHEQGSHPTDGAAPGRQPL